jgi:hypothetical protein
VFDFVQGITAVARSKPQQDARLDMEGKAKKLLERCVTANGALSFRSVASSRGRGGPLM